MSEYLKAEYNIEPAAGGAVAMIAAPGGGDGDEAAAVQTEFDVMLTGFGDKKLNVVKVVKNLTGATLMESKKLVESPRRHQGKLRRKKQKKSRPNWKRPVLRSSSSNSRFPLYYIARPASRPGGAG